MIERDYLGGTPQPTAEEREWAKRLAPILIEAVRKHTGSQDEIGSQVARELYCSMMRGRS